MSGKILRDGAAILISQEQYAEITPGVTIQYVKNLCSPSCKKSRCAMRIDERDLKRFSKNKVLIWYQPSNMVSGHDRPRLLERKEDPLDTEKAADESRLYQENESGN